MTYTQNPELSNLKQIFEAHYERHLGKTYTTVLESEGISVRMYPPTPECPHATLTTFGLSSQPSIIPDSQQDSTEFFPDAEWNELMLMLTSDIHVEYQTWAAQVLLNVARSARRHNRYLAHGQFMEITRNEKHPWLAVSIQYPELLPPQAVTFRSRLDQKCNWYAVVPIMEEELQVRRQRGVETFFTGLTQCRVTEVFNPDRISFLKPRLYA